VWATQKTKRKRCRYRPQKKGASQEDRGAVVRGANRTLHHGAHSRSPRKDRTPIHYERQTRGTPSSSKKEGSTECFTANTRRDKGYGKRKSSDGEKNVHVFKWFPGKGSKYYLKASHDGGAVRKVERIKSGRGGKGGTTSSEGKNITRLAAEGGDLHRANFSETRLRMAKEKKREIAALMDRAGGVREQRSAF